MDVVDSLFPVLPIPRGASRNYFDSRSSTEITTKDECHYNLTALAILPAILQKVNELYNAMDNTLRSLSCKALDTPDHHANPRLTGDHQTGSASLSLSGRDHRG